MPLNSRDERLSHWSKRIIQPHLNVEWVDETGEIEIDNENGLPQECTVHVSLMMIGHNNLVLPSNSPKRALIQQAFFNLN